MVGLPSRNLFVASEDPRRFFRKVVGAMGSSRLAGGGRETESRYRRRFRRVEVGRWMSIHPSEQEVPIIRHPDIEMDLSLRTSCSYPENSSFSLPMRSLPSLSFDRIPSKGPSFLDPQTMETCPSWDHEPLPPPKKKQEYSSPTWHMSRDTWYPWEKGRIDWVWGLVQHPFWMGSRYLFDSFLSECSQPSIGPFLFFLFIRW